MRLFGTDGVRGMVGKTMTPDLALRLGKAIGTGLKLGARVALGMDARPSSPMLAAAAASGLLSTGVHVVRLGVCPTPAVQLYAARHDDIGGAVIITASHNPAEWNGIKFIAEDGTEVSRGEEERVEALYESGSFRVAAWDGTGTLTLDETAGDAYVRAVLANVDAGAIRRKRFRVVLDPAGGPGALTTPVLLKSLGCETVVLHGELDGSFAGRPPEPVDENLGKLKAKVVATKAHLGIAHDGDADRCIFVDERGRTVSGEESFALIARHLLERTKGGLVCTPVSTGSVVEEVVKGAGGRVVYTAIGSPVVARTMRKEKAIFGGEENGGLIFPKHQYCRDALLTAATMLEVLALRGQSLGSLRDALPAFHVTKAKLECPDAKKPALLGGLRDWVRSDFPKARVDETDGMKVYFEDGWVLARPSGTEPAFRVFAESRSPARARELADRFLARCKRLLGDA